ncbi:MAG: hypothetical protein H7Z40_07865 [Phycisphaerae bacterium]|nr:hypothetical protein [Gemmatimonadaceae bacterium]
MPSPDSHAARPASTATPPTHRSRTTLWIVAAAVVGFFAGFVLQNSRLSDVRDNLAQTDRALHAARLEATLSAAVIEAQSARYEPARQRASDFYTGLQRRLLPLIAEEQQAEARSILSERDSIITSLARNDPASAGALRLALVRLRETISRAALDTMAKPGGP